MVITTWEVIVVGGAISIHLTTGDIICGSGCRYMLGYTHIHAEYCSIVHVLHDHRGIANWRSIDYYCSMFP